MQIVMSTCLALTMMAVAWSPACEKKQHSGTQGQANSQNATQSSAQSPSTGQTTAANQSQSPTSQNAKGDQMVGKVSSDAKTFKDSSDSKTYKVDNPDTLQSSEGQNVALLVHVDPDTGTIHVIQLEPTQEMSGKVSADDKTFVSDSDSKNYNVNNPEVLKGQEGKPVSVVVHVDPDNGTIYITQVEMPQQQ
jgi:hypothetical protein